MAQRGAIFKGNPFTGQGTLTLPNGDVYNSTIEDFTRGEYYQQGTQLVSRANPFNRMALGQQGDFTLTEYGDGVYNLVSQTLRGETNAVVGSDSFRMASGTVSIMTPTGQAIDVDFNGVVTAREDYQWGVYTQETGIERMVRIPAQYQTTAQLQAERGPGLRLATDEEVILNAAAWATTDQLADIIRKNWDEQYAEETGLDGLTADELADVSNYDLVQSVLLAIGTLSNVGVFKNVLFGGK